MLYIFLFFLQIKSVALLTEFATLKQEVKGMAKKKIQKTNAIRLVEQKKIPYVEHEYAWKEEDVSAKAAAETGVVANELIYKTLVAVGNNTGPIVAVIPGNHEVDLKKLAKVSKNKKVEMLHVRDLEATTGYIRGGCSPVGMKKQFPTFIESHAETHKTIVVSAGRRGLQMELSPVALCRLVNGTFAEISVE